MRFEGILWCLKTAPRTPGRHNSLAEVSSMNTAMLGAKSDRKPQVVE
jgi:hypothetical protein